MSAHTPGTWILGEPYQHAAGWTARELSADDGENSTHIADVNVSTPEGEANAWLLVNATKMKMLLLDWLIHPHSLEVRAETRALLTEIERGPSSTPS